MHCDPHKQCSPCEAHVLEGCEVAKEVHWEHGEIGEGHDHHRSGPDGVPDTCTVLGLLHNEKQYLLQLGKEGEGRGGERGEGRGGGKRKEGRGGEGREGRVMEVM